MGGFINSHMNSRYTPRIAERTATAHPSKCGEPDMPWVDGYHPGRKDWQGKRFFNFYDQMGHTSGYQLPYALDDAENFIRTVLPGGKR